MKSRKRGREGGESGKRKGTGDAETDRSKCSVKREHTVYLDLVTLPTVVRNAKGDFMLNEDLPRFAGEWARIRP